MGIEKLKELKWLQKENERLRRAVSYLTLDKLILKEATSENFCAPYVGGPALTLCVVSSRFLNNGLVAFWASTDPRSVGCQRGVLTKSAWSRT